MSAFILSTLGRDMKLKAVDRCALPPQSCPRVSVARCPNLRDLCPGMRKVAPVRRTLNLSDNPQNEPQHSNPTYPTCSMSPDVEAQIVVNLRKLLDGNGLSNVKIVGYEVCLPNLWRAAS